MSDGLEKTLGLIGEKAVSVGGSFSNSASQVHSSSVLLADAISNSIKVNSDGISTISSVISVNERCLGNVGEAFRATGELFDNLSGIGDDVSFLLDRSMLSMDAYSKGLLELLNYMDDINKGYNYLLEGFYIIISGLIFDFYGKFESGSQLKSIIESFQSRVDLTAQNEITINFVNKNLRYILSASCFDLNPNIYLRKALGYNLKIKYPI